MTTKMMILAETIKRAALSAFLVAVIASVGLAVECKSCKFECPEGTTNCWSCGTRVPDSKNPAELLSGKLIVVDVLPGKKMLAAKGGAGAVHDPSSEVEAVEAWISANPDNYAGALEKLDLLLDAVRGSVYEARVEDRIKRTRAALEETSRPMTAEDREKKAATMVMKIAGKVRRNADRPAENVRDLELLLAVAKGTSYEDYVRNLLKTQMAKMNR